ncbi:ABC-type multidrug transport system fused ATPase/permease subunit [Mycoplasmopsis mustelae]|uniref:ABC-type multidrug transport system fused ATPase/permease subunit n=1 Tax=Mycoplasmopsis mustelae TaxID=171289 RepID=A0A4R7UDC0_9BACT|nr:ABC transporter ATP-binding protein [Mycoplasmopsis mustelae]TDV24419.1 ABC-type multidrug transport system fused ATPase/permease subunit [Mycoplasmopsis mustelae]
MKHLLNNIKTPFILFLIISIITSTFQFVLSILEGYAIDSIVGKFVVVNNNPFLSFSILIIVVALAYLIMLVSTYFFYMLSNKFQIYTAKSIARIFYNQVFKADATSKLNYTSQSAFEQIINNSGAFANSSIIPLVDTIATGINLLLIIAFFASTSWIALVLVIAIFTFSVIPNFLFYKKISWYIETNQKALNQLTTKLSYLLERYSVLYYSNKGTLLYQFVEDEILNYYQKVYLNDNIRTWNSGLSNSINQIGSVIGIIVLGFLYISNFQYAPISLGTIYIFKKVIDESKDDFQKFINSLRDVLASRNLYKMLNLNLPLDTSKQILSQIENIEIKDLNFNYNNKLIFKNFNFIFEKGKKYAIIGKSGCGKSTLLNILINNINNYQGQILINGNDIKNFKDTSIKHHLSYLNAENFVFDQNVLANVSLLEKDKQKALNALKFVHMDEDIIQKFDESEFDCFNRLSLGQKQRISLARYIYQNKNILLLDESLSNLNKDLAQKILDNLLKTDKTVIIVSHHFSDEQLQSFNSVIRLDI